ncbi:hypothetical protein [Parafilimonas sp.]|uniref:hypothetical protein n=1 Tax=Parafilimonas sp. TaxID=1969739 RepID=UPI0039E4085B
MKKNSFLWGIILGIIVPVFGVLGYYFWKFYPTFSIGDFMHVIFSQKTILSAISTFALFANIVLLTLCLNTRRDETAKGIFIVSCIYSIAAIAAKLFF